MSTQGEPDVCMKCRLRPASVDWVGEGGALAYVHGMSARWCRRCALEAQLDYATKQAARIAELERELAIEIATSVPARPSGGA